MTVWHWFSMAYRFVRFTALGGTLILPLLGAASVTPHPPPFLVAGLLVVGVAYHCFAYVLNDYVDLPIDRTEPRRAADLLVCGVVRPWQALTFALLQIPLSLAVTAWLGGGRLTYAALLVAFALMAVYDIWGKRGPFPPLTDTIQGIGWAGLVIYGAALVGWPTWLTAAVGAFIVVFIVMANGIHGSLRDLANDLRCGARSTAIMLGVRPQGADGLSIPRSLIRYAIALQAALVALIVWPLAANMFGYAGLVWGATTGAILLLIATSLALFAAAMRSMGHRPDMLSAGMLHLVLTLSALLVLFAPYVDRWLFVTLLAVYVLPVMTHSWLYGALRWGFRQARQAWALFASSVADQRS